MKNPVLVTEPVQPDPGLELEGRQTMAKEHLPSISPHISKDVQTPPDSLINPESAKLEMATAPSELEWELAAQPALDRQKHILAGLTIYESTIEGNPAKTEADKLTDAVRTLDKCNTFVVRGVDINLEGEALGTRLEEGANRKRARTIDYQYLNYLDRLLELADTPKDNSVNNDNNHQTRTARSHSEDIETEACTHARSRQFLGDTVPRIEEGHHGDDMSERSSGTKRRTRNSPASTIEISADFTTGADTFGTAKEQIAESAGQDKPGSYIRGSSKLIRPSQRPEKEGKELRTAKSSKKEIDAFEQKAAITISAAPKREPWSAFARYKDPKKNVLPDYGPGAPAPKPPQQADQDMPIPGGVRPMNRLGNSSKPNPNASFKPQRPGASKPVDLTGDASRSRREPENPAKRQRFNNGLSTSPNEVDRTSPYNSRHSGPSSARSGHSQTLNHRERSASLGGRDSGLQEIRGVNNNMKVPRSRKRNDIPTSNKPSVINGSQRFNKESFPAQSKEDSTDPISDEGIQKAPSRPPGKPIQMHKLQTQQPSYQGSAFREPPRQKANFSSKVSNGPSMETAEASHHFPSISNSMWREGSSRERNQGNHARQKQSHSLHDDLDELSTEPFGNTEHPDIALRLSKKNQLSKSTNQGTPHLHIDEEESSEDEISKNSDIQSGKYGPSKANPRKTRGEESYTVLQIFAETMKWLLADHLARGVIRLDKKKGLLSFYEASDRLCLEFSTKEIEKIEVSHESSKIVLHKSRTQVAAGAIKIYIEMASNDDSRQFFGSLQSLDHNIKDISKSQTYLNSAFLKIAQTPIPARNKQVIAEGEPDDVRLAKARSEIRNEESWNNLQNAKKVSEGINGASRNPERRTQSRGVAIQMRGGSPSRDHAGVKASQRSSKAAAAFQAADFYSPHGNSLSNGADPRGTRSSGRVTAPKDTYRQSQRQRPRSPSPEAERWTLQHPDWVDEEKWKNTVIYPPDGKNKACVDMQDIQRLDEGEFLNDNLIVFYLRWLEDRLGKENPELASRIYFTNTFFYERLTKPGKGKAGGINYEAVERWTAKIDLLKYDYIVVPVNETIHWYVAIICNAPKLLKQLSSEQQTSQPDGKNGDSGDESGKLEAEGQPASSRLKSPAKTLPDEVNTEMKEMSLDDNASKTSDAHHSKIDSDAPAASEDRKDMEMVDLDPLPTNIGSDVVEQKLIQAKKSKRKSNPVIRKYNPNEPRIITLDSLGLTHSPTCTNLKKYLLREIQAKKNIEIEDPGSLGMTAKNIPQQDNHCDCGLFLLTYIEEFLKRPEGFVHDLLQQNEQDFSGWRSASNMRKHIRDLLFDLQREQNQEAASSKKERVKSKQAAKAGDKSASASSKAASREASKSVRGSPSPEKLQSMPGAKEPHLEESKDNQDVTPTSFESPKKVGVDAAVKIGSMISDAAESHCEEVREDSGENRGLVTKILAKVNSTVYHVFGIEDNGPLAGGLHDVRASESQPITIADSQEMDENGEHAEGTSANGKKLNKRKAIRARDPLQDELRGSKYSSPDRSIEIPESPVKDSRDNYVIHPHPLLSSQEEGQQDQCQSGYTLGKRTNNSRYRGSRETLATNSHINDQDVQEWNGFEITNSDTSLDNIQLIDSSPRRLHKEFVADRPQEEDEDESPLQDTLRPEQPTFQLLSSSSSPSPSPMEVPKHEMVAATRSRDRVARRSPGKRPSSHVAETQPSKRQKVVVDLAKEHPFPNANQRDRHIRSHFRDSSDLEIIGSKTTPMRSGEGVQVVDR